MLISRATLVRQSTTVPNTSRTRAFTLGFAVASVMCFLPARGAGSSLTQGTGRENVYKRPRARQPAQRSRIRRRRRSEEHTSELQSLMRISYAVFCLKNKNNQHDRRLQQHNKNKES